MIVYSLVTVMTCSQIITINNDTTTHLGVWGVDFKEQIPNLFLTYKVETVSTCLVPYSPVYDILDKLVTQFRV